MSEFSLPPVAKSVFYPCKKCDAERYHTVLAHKSETSASIQCEICGSKKTYSLTATKNKDASGKPKKLKVAGFQQWRELRDKIGDSGAKKFTIKAQFDVDDAIDHPKFGLGFVTYANTEKIDVAFEDGPKSLIHNRE
ncbi:MAG: hypothetical protein CL675_00150 [Bdellovibrionaceae bacterium]|nr:hypothetical protein [Pseudobdellovibrionaceae bacterium]